MIGKKFILGVFVLSVLFLIMNLNFSSAVISVTRPANNTNFSGSAFFNVTYINQTDFTDATNATFYYNLSGAWTLLGSVNCTKVAASSIGYCNGTISFPNVEGIFSINATLWNTTALSNKSASVVTYNVILDSVAPNVSAYFPVTVSNGNFSGIIILNISVSDGGVGIDSVYFNITNSSGVQVNFTRGTNSGGNVYYSRTINTSTYPDGKYNITVYANDTLNNLNNSQRVQGTVDNTAPTATFSCSPISTTTGQTVTCTCTPSDNINGSGINTSYVSSGVDFSPTPDTQTVGSYTLTCNFYDLAGNFNSTTTIYNVTAIPPAAQQSSTTPSTNPSQVNVTNTFIQITPANISILGNFNPSFGINEIRINVSTEANNVQIIVIKYDSKPSAVSVAKTGSVFTYLQIQTQNLATHLNTATLKIQVNKTWISNNSLTKNDTVLFRYNESSNKWEGLITTFVNEDSTYYYYNIKLYSFSYFAIGQKDAITIPSTTTETTLKDFTWLWVALVGIVVVVILVIGFLLIKRKTY